MRQFIAIVLVAVIFLCNITVSSAQDVATAATILSVKSALEDVLKQFNAIIQTAGNEVRSTGVSLSQNAGNLLSDIDQKYANRLNDTVESLSKLERQTIDDAILLTKQMQQATESLAKTTGSEARLTIAEADITAYNALYSLPCRDWIPRVLYVTPSEVRPSGDIPVLTVRGNFLDLGDEPAISIDGNPAKLLSRSRNELKVEIPPHYAESIDKTKAVRVSMPLNQTTRTNVLWLWCTSQTRKVENELSAAVTFRPNVQFKVSGVISGTKGSYDYLDLEPQRYNRSDKNCDASYADNQQFCVPEGWQVDKVIGWAIFSANCNSNVSDPQVAGGNCMVVPAHLGGCGYDNFVVGKNCKGRGFFDYTIRLRAKKGARAPIEAWQFEQASAVPVQKSFVFTHPQSMDGFENPDWTYEISVQILEGKKAPYTIQASNVNPNPEIIVTRINAGVLSIEIKPLPHW